MRRDFLLIALALFISAPVGISAQGKPDFSGKWVLDTTSGEGGGRGGPSTAGVELTVKQDANTLTLTRRQGDQSVSTEIINLDGSETRDTVQSPGGPRERVLRAMWEGNKLVILGAVNVDGNAVRQNRVMSMEGGNLVIEQITPGGGGPTIKRVFRKG